MNLIPSKSEVVKLQELAQKYLKEKKYSQTMSLYKKGITLQLEVKSNWQTISLAILR